MKLLARHSIEPTIRHWNDIKRIFRYLKGTHDMGLYFPNKASQTLVGYANVANHFDTNDAKSQTDYVSLNDPTAISWKSSKQYLTTTSSKPC